MDSSVAAKATNDFSRFFDKNELVQRKYPGLFMAIHSVFIIINALMITFMEIVIGLQSTFLSQIVDASIASGITISFFYVLIGILQLILSMKFFSFHFI